MASLFSEDDYPVDALRRGEEGIVSVLLEVTPEGRVGDCRIRQSSGSASLDAGTCGILRRRARFVPARDQYGKPIGDTYGQTVKWLLERIPFAPGDEIISLQLDADGAVEECTAVPERDGSPDCDKLAALIDAIRSDLKLPAPTSGEALTLFHHVSTDGRLAPPAIPRGLAEIWQQSATYDVRPDGRLADCKRVEPNNTPVRADLCVIPIDGPFEFSGDGRPRAIATTVTVLSAIRP